MPSDAINPNVRTSMGSASYAPENDALLWKIKSFPGGKVIASSNHLCTLFLSYNVAVSDIDIEDFNMFSPCNHNF